MLLAILFAPGLIVGLVAALTLRGTRGRFVLAFVGIAVWVAYATYIEGIASCPTVGECDKALGLLFVAVVLIGWLAGVALSWVVRRPRRD
jgi:hypothetical protein